MRCKHLTHFPLPFHNSEQNRVGTFWRTNRAVKEGSLYSGCIFFIFIYCLAFLCRSPQMGKTPKYGTIGEGWVITLNYHLESDCYYHHVIILWNYFNHFKPPVMKNQQNEKGFFSLYGKSSADGKYMVSIALNTSLMLNQWVCIHLQYLDID